MKDRSIKFIKLPVLACSIALLSGCSIFSSDKIPDNKAPEQTMTISVGKNVNSGHSFYVVININDDVKNYMAETKDNIYQQMLDQKLLSYQVFPGQEKKITISPEQNSKYLGVYFLDKELIDAERWSYLLPVSGKSHILNVTASSVDIN
ncbi:MULTISPECIES: type VI secretion system lipoprotein IglE [Cysteiniphilum]|uniref:Type VI lipoprotein IgE-like C-terminal domain-containing protein n=1 Tax=Cysteiniphilum litorale TaxID=2056700 RepID=A0A8J3EBJ5_9GAMM|nr:MULTISPECIES: type VI secretion system lipoprotein IglE [Cysteiniphilum]GGG09169.1 hypothetical protein GCM10010995_28460 [Cysteiniphilum litorale]